MTKRFQNHKLSVLKVVFVVSTLGQTGPTRQLLNIIKYLNSDRIRATIVTLSHEPIKTLKPEFDALDVQIYTLGLCRITGLLLGRYELRKLLSRVRPHIIHSQGIRSDLLVANLTDYSHRLTTQRNIPEHDYPLLYGKLLGTLLAQIHRKALTHIPNLVVCSTSIAHSSRGIESIIIRNGVDLAWCPELPTTGERSSARAALGLGQNGLIFAYAGPLIKRKNPDFLIKSFLQWDKHSLHQLLLLGDGALIETCRELAQNHANVMVMGHISDISPYLCAADVFLSASKSEGFPNSVLEALMFGLSLILSDIAPHREIVENLPQGVQLFSLDSTIEFFKSLDLIHIDEETRRQARRLAELEYSAGAMAQRYMDLYETIYSDQ